LVQHLLDQGKGVAIPLPCTNKQPHDRDRHLYKERHLVENFFAGLKQCRVIATRYDKTSRNLLGAIYLAASMAWLP
jgi:transposase